MRTFDAPSPATGLRALADAPAMAALYPSASVVLILTEAWDPDVPAFLARFRDAVACLVTADPALAERAADGLAVETGDPDRRGFLAHCGTNYGPDLVVDCRTVPRAIQARAFGALYPILRHGGLYAMAGPAARHAGLHRLRLAARAGDPGLLAVGRVIHAHGHHLVAKPPRPPVPVRLAPARRVAAIPPVSLGAPAYTRLVPHLVGAPAELAAGVMREAGRRVVPPEALVCHLHDARVFGAGIVQVGGAIVAESLINLDPAGPLWALRLTPDGTGSVHHTLARPRRVKGRTVLLAQTWAENYGHWIIEGLPRLHAVARTMPLAGLRVAINAAPGMEPVYVDSLGAFGIGPERIVWLNGREVDFETLIYPTPVTVQPWVKSPLVAEAARAIRATLTAGRDEPSASRLYISRNHWGRRRLVNEDALLPLLAARGYHVIHPQALSFADQVRVFSGARSVVGAMGAAMANIAFAPDGVRCLMLTNRDMVDDFFLDLASLKDGHYVSLHGTSLAPEQGMHADFTIDPHTFRATLDAHGF